MDMKPMLPQMGPEPATPSPQAVGMLGQMMGAVGPHRAPLNAPPVGGLNALLAHRFEALQHAIQAHGGDLYIFSGQRGQKDQRDLYQRALQKYGGDEQLAGKAVAQPGKSSHDPLAGIPHGLGHGAIGIDVRGDLHMAHKLAPHFGLAFTSKDHPWHLELALAGGKGGAG